MKTLNFAQHPGVFLLTHTATDPDPAEWNAYLAAVNAARQQGRIGALLVVSEGGGPDAKQRAQVVGAYEQSVRVAVCTSSAVAKRIATAIGWVYGSNLRGFDYDDLAAAIAFLHLAPSQLGELTVGIRALQGKIGARLVRV